MTSSNDNDMSVAQAEETADNNDFVSNDELQEMHSDLNMNQIAAQLAGDEARAEAQSNAEHVEEEPRHAAKQGRKTYHTGPKGVLTDFAEAQLKLRAKRLQQKLAKQRKVYMQLDEDNGDHITPFELIDPNTNASNTNGLGAKQLRRENAADDSEPDSDENDTKNESDDDDDDDEEDVGEDEGSEDEAILLQYKLQRMQMIEDHRPRYGAMKECNVVSFVEQVEKAAQNVITVMHIYQDYLHRCVQLNRALSKMAHAYLHIQFLRARSDRIGLKDYADIGLPTIVIWRNGQQIHNFVAVHRHIGEPFSVADVEEFFLQKKIIRQQIVLPENPLQKNENQKNSSNVYQSPQNKKTLNTIRRRIRRNKLHGRNAAYKTKNISNTNITINNSMQQSQKFADDSSSSSELDID